MTNYGDYFDANYDIIAINPDADFTTFYEDSNTIDNQDYNEENVFDYTLTTPMHINAGATFFINKNGFISADIEYVDYSTMKLEGNQGSLDNDNFAIKDLYNSVLNYRAGAEWRIKTFRVRAGYGYQPSPYKNKDIDRNIQTFSAGLGFRSSKFFVDLATSYKKFSSTYAPYLLDNPNDNPIYETSFVKIENANLNFALTVGLFF
jgi:long-subunit fatty acid transport protein